MSNGSQNRPLRPRSGRIWLRHCSLNGTTTAVYYGTTSVETTTMLAATCAELGQRALAGRVAMDLAEGTPDWHRDADASTALDIDQVWVQGRKVSG